MDLQRQAGGRDDAFALERTGAHFAAIAAAAIAFETLGCSFIFTSRAPAEDERPPPPQPIDCSTSRVAPMLDTAIAGYQVFRTVTAVTARDSDYSGAPISRKADIAAGAGLFGLFAVSATYGYVTTADCDDAKGQRAREIRQIPAAPSQTAPVPYPAIPVQYPAAPPTPAPTPPGTPAHPPQSTPPPPSSDPVAPSNDGGTDLTRDAPF